MEPRLKFWMIWSLEGSFPKTIYSSRMSAEQDCEKLCRNHIGHTFVVLEAVTGRHYGGSTVIEYQ